MRLLSNSINSRGFVFGVVLVCVFCSAAFGQPWLGSGTAEDPYQIWTAEDMNAIGANQSDWDAHFKLMADIDLSDFNGLNGNPSFNIIGVTETPFPGTFDGNNHTISNFTHSSTGTHCVAIFGYVSGANAEIKNLGLIDPNVNAGTGDNVGSLVGYCHEGTITGCYVDSGTVSGSGYTTGGLVGQIRGALVTNCYTTGIVVKGGYIAGGLVAWNSNATISSCYSTGSVLGDEEVGGLVGQNDAGTITNCYSTGSATATGWFVGGLVGMNYYALITNSYSTSKVTGNTRVGGLVGSNNGGMIVSSFWDKQTSGRTNMCGWECCGGTGCDDGNGKTTAEMQDPNTFLLAGWDFFGESGNGTEDIWRLCSAGTNYPKLTWQFPLGDFVCPDGVNFIDYAFFAEHWLHEYLDYMRTVRDEFNVVSYSGSDGSESWSGDWLESGESDGPVRGILSVVDGRLQIGAKNRVNIPIRSLTREADLSDATTATLTYDYMVENNHNAGLVSVQISGDGGLNWDTLADYFYDSGSGYESFDVTPYISSNAQIRFETGTEMKMYLYVDIIQIEYDYYLWSRGCDFNQDLVVDIYDLLIFTDHWLD